jgi:hypothetical protein
MNALMIRRTAAPVTIMLAATGSVLLLGRSSTVEAQVVVQPFYLEQTTSAIDSNTRVFGPFRGKTVARRGDGVTVVVDGLGPALAGKIRRVMSPDGVAVTVWENVTLKTTWPANSDNDATALADQLKNASPDCRPSSVGYDENGQPSESNERFLRFETVSGQRAAVLEVKLEKYIFTTWRAPALACEDLYYTSERIEPDGSPVLTLETITTQLALGEPDPLLFTIDAGYRESKPSLALTALIHRISSSPLPPEIDANLRREGAMLDRRYQPVAAPKLY